MATGVSWCAIGSVVNRSPSLPQVLLALLFFLGGGVLSLYWESPPPKLRKAPPPEPTGQEELIALVRHSNWGSE